MKKNGLLLFCFLLISCFFNKLYAQKINGVSYVASRIKIEESHVNSVKNINANYAALMPFGFVRNLNTPNLTFNSDRQWFGETEAGIIHYAKVLKSKGVKTMLKPQIWVSRGEFTGLIKMDSEENWKSFEADYQQFILTFAKIAASNQIEIFCIGTELELFVKNRPQFWQQLIKEVRKIYKGKLTYAANWDEYKRISFWNHLDFIGVDAYFPLTDEKQPTLQQYKDGWQQHKKELLNIHKQHKKPILFTEYGYRSVDFNGKQPWQVDKITSQVNLIAQQNALEALYQEFWNEKWFAGGFVWKWFVEYEKVGGETDNRFTPQNKPAEKTIANWYGKN